MLTCLGLTFSQAKVYIALLRIGTATIKSLSKYSKVARQETYRIVDELQESGLVEKVIAKPSEFKAVPMKNCVSILIEHQKSEISKHEKEASELLQKLKEITAEAPLQEEKSEFILVPEKEAVFVRTTKALENSQRSMNSIISRKKFLYLMFNAEKFGLQKAMKRGVKLRFITEKPEDENPVLDIVKTLEKNYPFRVKYLLDPPSAHIGLFDEKELFINTSTIAGLTETPLLWSKNRSLAAMARDYFEIMWLTAI
jgi:sugar-specific transcriptional regulator TrmB